MMGLSAQPPTRLRPCLRRRFAGEASDVRAESELTAYLPLQANYRWFVHRIARSFRWVGLRALAIGAM
jgi:hypothetical protein